MNKPLKLLSTRLIISFSVITIILVCGILLYQEKKYYSDKRQTSKINAERLVRVLADHVEDTFLYVDLLLKQLIEKQECTDSIHNNSIKQIDFNNIKKEAPYIAAIIMANNQGKIEVLHNQSSHLKTVFNINNSIKDYDYFKFHQDHTERFLKLSSLVTPDDARPFIILSRKIINSEGKFAGVILIAIDSDHFISFFESIETDNNTEMAVLLDDGKLLLQSPDIIEDIDVLKTIKEESIIFTQIDNDIKTKEKFINGYLHVFSFKSCSNLPISTALVTFEGNIHKNWLSNRDNLMLFLVIVVMVSSMVAILGKAITRQIEQTHHFENLSYAFNKVKYDFIARVINEIKVPANAVIGFSEMLYSGYLGKLNTQQQERTKDIRTCSEHIINLINNLLKLATTSKEGVSLNEETVLVKDLFSKTLMIVNQRSTIAAITIDINPDINKLPPIKADPFKLMQTFLTIINYHIKNAPPSSVVTINGRITEQNDLEINFYDYGAPINESEIKQTLSLFEQNTDISYIDDEKLALSLAKHFIELHQGSLLFKSSNEQGNIVTVIIPNNRIKHN